MRGRARWAIVAAAAGLLLVGCDTPRRKYDAVALGMAAPQVRKILGAPRYEFADEWVYTREDPRDLTKVTIYFGGEGDEKTVVGRSWYSPERPQDNHREGQVP